MSEISRNKHFTHCLSENHRGLEFCYLIHLIFGTLEVMSMIAFHHMHVVGDV